MVTKQKNKLNNLLDWEMLSTGFKVNLDLKIINSVLSRDSFPPKFCCPIKTMKCFKELKNTTWMVSLLKRMSTGVSGGRKLTQ